MQNWQKNTYVAVEFSILGGHFAGLYDRKLKKRIHFGSPPIVEIAAVKVQKGKIAAHYTSFIGPDGADPENVSDDEGMMFYGITPAHLIGAPSLQEAAETFYRFAQDGIILVREKSSSYNVPFDLFRSHAKSFGYVFNHPVLSMSDIVQAAKIKELFADQAQSIGSADVLKIAQNLSRPGFWSDIFSEYGILFDPDGRDPFCRSRNDPLSWALAFARLFIAISGFDDGAPEEIVDDGTCPFL